MRSKPMFSAAWFDTFARTIPPATTDGDVDAIARLAPPGDHPRLLDIGSGIGRTARGLAARGYQVTGIDANVDALCRARQSTPGGRFVALDCRHVGRLPWTFDVVTNFWNSLGFGTRADDLDTLTGVHRILQPGGRLLLDLYHPDWLAAHQMSDVVDERGATVDRWLAEGRSKHLFRYADGTVDDIQFNVYDPDEIETMLKRAGLRPNAFLVWWKTALAPSAEHARYQVVAVCDR